MDWVGKGGGYGVGHFVCQLRAYVCLGCRVGRVGGGLQRWQWCQGCSMSGRSMRGGSASREIIVLLFFTCVGNSVANARSSGANLYFSGLECSGAMPDAAGNLLLTFSLVMVILVPSYSLGHNGANYCSVGIHGWNTEVPMIHSSKYRNVNYAPQRTQWCQSRASGYYKCPNLFSFRDCGSFTRKIEISTASGAPAVLP